MTSQLLVEKRKRQIRRLLLLGVTEAQIGNALGITPRAVRQYVKRLKEDSMAVIEAGEAELKSEVVQGFKDVIEQAWITYYKQVDAGSQNMSAIVGALKIAMTGWDKLSTLYLRAGLIHEAPRKIEIDPTNAPGNLPWIPIGTTFEQGDDDDGDI